MKSNFERPKVHRNLSAEPATTPQVPDHVLLGLERTVCLLAV